MISKQAENYFKAKALRESPDRLIKMTVSGNSMWPFLRHGQEVVVRRLKKDENCNIGDIVVIKVRKFFLVHRVLFRRKTKDGSSWEYFTKGDRRLVGDGWREEGEIAGGVVDERRFNNLRKAIALIQSEILLLVGVILWRR